jgi:hypothetical protein
MYVVEIGGLEVMVTLLKKGSMKDMQRPVFDVDAGLDWDGDYVPLCSEDRESAIDYVISNYNREVYN